ncbi:Deoxyribodipyrimidine photo-lyase [Leptothrix cholodnii SP-6]|uniref:Deoxyribodipyrimidine photo-lyase n=1 Tax=Leptothrix cholodnii (strain ATCC 51168 / LMG 8142 / SP-6) TaxID=395495 RepID=B1Y5C9_LEPCP|nr:FAD-binding domain-containing protein [Leptothrix cholodnii]ACB33517.1 Deoxyribodipyrimidine photo-lyase [Leptothrix cholodnii SP-6]
MSRAVVWFKRDLRVTDHAPLAEAARCDAALALFIIEPAWLDSPECHPRHVTWLLKCLAPLRDALAARGLPLLVRTGEAVEVLAALRREFACTRLFSHEETGPGWSYARDRAVARWCRAHGVAWTEWPQTGVIRRLKDRRGWAGRWQQRMDAPCVRVPAGWRAAPGFAPSTLPADLPTLRELGVATAPDTPPAGEAAAQQMLQSFLGGRALGYRRHLSSPLAAEAGCSRLSEHLAFGTLSLRMLHQATEATLRATSDRELAYSLRGFAGRLRWHCHFMQKLEDEPAIEWRNFARSADGLRPGDGSALQTADRERLQAWCEGRTGFPMVDACMRQLRATGWLNFRMRAMLVSFAAYHLWLHWREPGLFLARQFLDFEPGIHWSQMQMQSGTTGINTLRIYSPAKQALDHDPQGEYVRRWVPEFGSAAYPAPIVDERAAVAAAKQRLYGLRQTPEAHDEAGAIQHKHGSRKSGLPPSGNRPTRRTRAADDGQGRLF